MTFCVCRLCKSHGVNGVGCKFIQLEIKGVRKMLKVWICDKCDKELDEHYREELRKVGYVIA